MALCGKNDALTAVTDKIADIEKEITAKLDSAASEIAGALDTGLQELEKELDNLAEKIPDEPVLSFQEAMDEYVNLTLDATKSNEATAKLLELKNKFTDTLEGQGFDIDQLVSDATGALGAGASPAVSTIEKTVEDENTDTVIIQEEFIEISQVQGMKEGTNIFSGTGFTTEQDGDDTIITTSKVFKKLKAIYTVEQTVDPSLDPLTGLSLPSLDDLGLPSLSLPALPGLDLSGVPPLSPDSLLAGQANMKDTICNMPNLEVSTGGSGVETKTQKASGTDNLILEKTPTKIISVQGRTANTNFFGNIQYTQDGKSIFLRETYAEVKVEYEVAVVKQKAKESLIPQEGGEVELKSVFTEAQTQIKKAEDQIKNITIDKEVMKKNAEELKDFASNTPSIVPDAQVSKQFIEQCKRKEEDIKTSIVANGKVFDPAERKKVLEDAKVDAVETAEVESGVKVNEVSPMTEGDLSQAKKKVLSFNFDITVILTRMRKISRSILIEKKLPIEFQFKSKAGVKYKVQLDTAIKGELTDTGQFRRTFKNNRKDNVDRTNKAYVTSFKPTGDFDKSSRKKLAKWLIYGETVRKNAQRDMLDEYYKINMSLKTNPDALTQVNEIIKKYVDNPNSRISKDSLIDYLSNYEALLVITEIDGKPTEDLFGFHLLDDA